MTWPWISSGRRMDGWREEWSVPSYKSNGSKGQNPNCTCMRVCMRVCCFAAVTKFLDSRWTIEGGRGYRRIFSWPLLCMPAGRPPPRPHPTPHTLPPPPPPQPTELFQQITITVRHAFLLLYNFVFLPFCRSVSSVCFYTNLEGKVCKRNHLF